MNKKDKIKELIELGKLEEAIIEISKASSNEIQLMLTLQLSRLTDLKSRNNLGVLTFSEYEVEKNRITFALLNILFEEISLDSRQAEQFYNYGISLLAEGKYQEAIHYFSKTIVEDNSFANAYIERGAAYIALEKYEEAVIDFNFALDINPQQVFALYNRGIANFQLERFQEACVDMNKIKALGFDLADTFLLSFCKSYNQQ